MDRFFFRGCVDAQRVLQVQMSKLEHRCEEDECMPLWLEYKHLGKPRPFWLFSSLNIAEVVSADGLRLF